jgi:hypothetical protein
VIGDCGTEPKTLRIGQFSTPRLDIAKLDALDNAGQVAVRDVSY